MIRWCHVELWSKVEGLIVSALNNATFCHTFLQFSLSLVSEFWTQVGKPNGIMPPWSSVTILVTLIMQGLDTLWHVGEHLVWWSSTFIEFLQDLLIVIMLPWATGHKSEHASNHLSPWSESQIRYHVSTNVLERSSALYSRPCPRHALLHHLEITCLMAKDLPIAHLGLLSILMSTSSIDHQPRFLLVRQLHLLDPASMWGHT